MKKDGIATLRIEQKGYVEPNVKRVTIDIYYRGKINARSFIDDIRKYLSSGDFND